MAKFCGKCGSKLDEITGLCPKCDAQRIAELRAQDYADRKLYDMPDEPLSEREEKKLNKEYERYKKRQQKEYEKHAKRAAMTTGEKIGHFVVKLLVILLVLVFLAVCSAVALSYFDVVDIPGMSKFINQLTQDNNHAVRQYEIISEKLNDIENEYCDNNGYITDATATLEEVSNYLEVLLGEGTITEYQYTDGDTCIYYKIDNWLTCFYTPYIENALSGGTGENVSIYTYEPFEYQLKAKLGYLMNGFKGPDDAAQKIASTFPDVFAFRENYDNEEVTVENIQSIGKNSIVIWNGHGGYNDRLGSILGLGTKKWDQTTILLHQQEFSDEAIGINQEGQIYITPIFFEKYMEDEALQGSLVYLNACNSCSDSRLAQSLWDKGARAIIGNTSTIWIPYGTAMTYKFFEGLATKSQSGGKYNKISDALNYAKESEGEYDPIFGGKVVAVYRDDFTLEDMKNTDDSVVLSENNLFDNSNIPTGAVEFNGHYYCIYDEDAITDWNAAKAFCEAQGGYLATITSAEEDALLYSYITDAGYSSVMFGLTDQEQTDDWRWVTGEELSYQNWQSGEPNHQGGYEHYGMYYEQNTDGSWNDGSGAGGPFLCEWGEYQTTLNSQPQEPVRTTSDERDIVLVLDVSGSMSGTPMEETKKASINFIDTILNEDASIGIVTYDNSASMLSDFSVNKTALTTAVSNIYDGGGTNIESGLEQAHSMLSTSGAKKKIIVLMSDGEPNDGKEGEALISYANEIKEDGILIYTLGFFESLGGEKSSAQYLMEKIASEGCHYEVANADDLVFFFDDVADQINGQRYIYIRIACPVDISVSYDGETLNSSEDDLNTRTNFGTLSFEDSDESGYTSDDDRIKVLRLKEGVDYDIQIVGTGRGMMDYTIAFMDENGDYSDFRRFEDIRITRRTVIDTVASVSNESILNIDEDGDGKYDVKLRAEENGYGEEIRSNVLLYAVIAGGAVMAVVILSIILIMNKRRKERMYYHG